MFGGTFVCQNQRSVPTPGAHPHTEPGRVRAEERSRPADCAVQRAGTITAWLKIQVNPSNHHLVVYNFKNVNTSIHALGHARRAGTRTPT
jgi:hypothetical protein